MKMTSCFKRCMTTNIKAAQPSILPEFQEVLYNKDVGIRMIEFNRPKVMNALNLNMIRHLTPRLQQYEKSKVIHTLVFRGNGEKAFCAGGDIRFLYENAKNDDTRPLTHDFFREEYRLNHHLGTCSKPVVSFLNGLTMGGGVGLSVHGKFVIATENTVFAMPETAIGFFPDVGGSHFLTRLGRRISEKGGFSMDIQDAERAKNGQGLGTYLALTGERVTGEEVAALRIATHYMESKKYDQVLHALTSLRMSESMSDDEKIELIGNVLEEIVPGNPAENVSDEFLETTENIFGANNDNDTVEGIFDRLENHNSEWSQKILKKLQAMSPLSLKVSHRQMREGATKDLGECLKMEYGIACHMMENPDFIEGVRALIVDKTADPQWRHQDITKVQSSEVEHYFQPLSEDDELILF